MDAVENKRQLPEWAVKLLIWVGPTLTFLLVSVLLFGLTPDPLSVVSFCMIPTLGLVLTRLIFLFRSKRAFAAMAWRAALWLVLLAALLFFCLLPPRVHHRSSRLNAQGRFETAAARIYHDAFPAPLELGSPKSVVYHSHYISLVVWEAHSYTLLCRYDAADYEAEKAALETRYSFRTEPLQTGHTIRGEEAATIEPYTRIGDDCFRVVFPGDGADDIWDDFFRNCFLIVTNDARHEIGYVVFQDKDLDEAEDLAEFLNEYCGWKHVR